MQCLEKKELIRVYFVLTLVLILLLILLGLLLAYVICPWICYELQQGDPGGQDHEPVLTTVPLLSAGWISDRVDRNIGREDTPISTESKQPQRCEAPDLQGKKKIVFI